MRLRDYCYLLGYAALYVVLLAIYARRGRPLGYDRDRPADECLLWQTTWAFWNNPDDEIYDDM